VPWCATCDRFYNPNTLQPDGTCPTCGQPVAEEERPPEKLRKFSEVPAPWHFKVLVGATAIYLAWRALQGVDWVAHHL
jgi:hypothetical protein